MVDGINGSSSNKAAGATSKGSLTGGAPVMGKDEFLMLLVEQLKAQDPLDPSKPEEFAAQLAQFTQVEKLISIDEKIGGSSLSELGSLAGFLGREVTLNTSTVSVDNGDGGLLKFNLAAQATDVKVELRDAGGKLVKTVDAGALEKGKQTIALDSLGISNGDYSYKVVANYTGGGTSEVKASVAGIVSGFIPGDEPVLVVGGKEIAPADILGVSVSGQS